MLKNVNPLLTPDILHALASMGHGDEVAIVDAHYPAAAAGKASVLGTVLRMDGADTEAAIRAVLSVFPLDGFVTHPAQRMMVDNAPDTIPNVQAEAQRAVNETAGAPSPFGIVPRQSFYERAKQTYCVIITGETRGWGCFIFKKGLDVTPDLPNSERSAHLAGYAVDA